MPASVDLNGMKVAVLIADGFEQVEFDEPVKALTDAGARVDVIVPSEEALDHVKGLDHVEPAGGAKGDRIIDDASPGNYDALLIPGGAISPDQMRDSEKHLHFVREMNAARKPIASICHGPWLLLDAGILEGRDVTSWEKIHRDFERGRANWKDQAVVRDGNIVTSRKPDDIPAFNDTMLRLFAERKKQEAEARGRA